MTAKQKLRVLIRAAIEICDRDCPNIRWRETAASMKEVELVDGKSFYLGHVRRIIGEVALEHGVPIHEIEWAISMNADSLQALRCGRKSAEERYPPLGTYHVILDTALQQAEERFYAAPNVYPFIPSGRMPYRENDRHLPTLTVTV